MTKPVILTGLRANNDLTLGNYFGGMLPMIDMAKTKADEYQINMFIPDLHSFTTPIDHSQLFDQVIQNAKLFAAAGLPLDNDGINLYRQSFVPAHSELTWILDNFAGFGEMSRMTQFKDKAGIIDIRNDIHEVLALMSEDYGNDVVTRYIEYIKTQKPDAGAMLAYDQSRQKLLSTREDRVSVGLFNYPVLMAADILLYGAKYVPVGDDQTQHLEFTRDIAERMNTRFGDLFVVPEPVKKQREFFGKDQGLRIMDLVDPSRKMSKSDEFGKGVIFLNDSPDAAAKKVMSATTDDKANVTFDRENQPGISNLLEILSLIRGESIEETAKQFEGQTRYGDFKKIVADEVRTFLVDFQSRLANVDEGEVMRKLEASEARMNEQANATLFNVQCAVGLRQKA